MRWSINIWGPLKRCSPRMVHLETGLSNCFPWRSLCIWHRAHKSIRHFILSMYVSSVHPFADWILCFSPLTFSLSGSDRVFRPSKPLCNWVGPHSYVFRRTHVGDSKSIHPSFLSVCPCYNNRCILSLTAAHILVACSGRLVVEPHRRAVWNTVSRTASDACSKQRHAVPSTGSVLLLFALPPPNTPSWFST